METWYAGTPCEYTRRSHINFYVDDSTSEAAEAFTSEPIAKALRDAHRHGVRVHVILDRSQRAEQCFSAGFLANQGVPTMIDTSHAIAHNKVIIIDGELALTGRFNFTKVAQERTAENLLISRAPALARQYTQNWNAHRQHSSRMAARGYGSDWTQPAACYDTRVPQHG